MCERYDVAALVLVCSGWSEHERVFLGDGSVVPVTEHVVVILTNPGRWEHRVDSVCCRSESLVKLSNLRWIDRIPNRLHLTECVPILSDALLKVHVHVHVRDSYRTKDTVGVGKQSLTFNS